MPVNKEAYISIKKELDPQGITLVAVSKTKPVEDIQALYDLGQRDFGENYVQEMVGKAAQLPADIRWHFIGHLQTNKVKLIVPVVQLIHGVDSLKLLKEINKEAARCGRITDCLLQVHIAREETKFGLDAGEIASLLASATELELKHVRICGLMGMASFTDDRDMVRKEFRELKEIFEECKRMLYANTGADAPVLTTLSMGMSSDYRVAVEEGSTLVRIGSLLFGEREKK